MICKEIYNGNADPQSNWRKLALGLRNPVATPWTPQRNGGLDPGLSRTPALQGRLSFLGLQARKPHLLPILTLPTKIPTPYQLRPLLTLVHPLPYPQSWQEARPSPALWTPGLNPRIWLQLRKPLPTLVHPLPYPRSQQEAWPSPAPWTPSLNPRIRLQLSKPLPLPKPLHPARLETTLTLLLFWPRLRPCKVSSFVNITLCHWSFN